MTETCPLPLFHDIESLVRSNLQLHPAHDPNDVKQAVDFLLSYRGSSATFNAYRREIERFILWTSFVRKKSFKDIHREDIEAFIQFCQTPPKKWIGLKSERRFIYHLGELKPNPHWRPFLVSIPKSLAKNGKVTTVNNYQLSEKALQAIFAVLSSFFNFMLQQLYLSANPVMQIRQKSKYFRRQQTQKVVRRLSELQWGYVIETAQIMAEEDPIKHERTLFIMSALFGMYLRISELVASERWLPLMSHFFRDQDGLCWFRTVGKGNKERLITVSDEMLNSLKRYRQSLGLSSFPPPAENIPLISKNKGHGPVTSSRQIRAIVQECFDFAYERMRKDLLEEDAEALRVATVHWLRHTGISEDVKHRPREHVRDDAGHSSSAITDKYIDIELRERHASGRKKKIMLDD